jgi:hypothetical protein
MDRVTALLAVPPAHIREESLNEMEDGEIPVSAEGSVGYILKD